MTQPSPFPPRHTAKAGRRRRLVLPFELRQRSRLLAVMDSGEEVGLLLPRGTVLRGGDRLQVSDGRLVEVVAAPEQVSIVRGADTRTLARAAYHLGNRHVAVQITSDSLRFLRDHVLDDMLRGLGLKVRSRRAALRTGGRRVCLTPTRTRTRIRTAEAASPPGVAATDLHSSSHQLLRLLHLASPALPIGGFHFSQGLEYAVECGWMQG